jgi:hypothetical protein
LENEQMANGFPVNGKGGRQARDELMQPLDEGCNPVVGIKRRDSIGFSQIPSVRDYIAGREDHIAQCRFRMIFGSC